MIIELSELTREELLGSFVEIKIDSSDEFLKIRETLTRMGVESTRPNLDEMQNSVVDENGDVTYEKLLHQSCHILHKRGKYYIIHFKELYGLDGKRAQMSEEDYARRNSIAQIIERWGLCEVISVENSESPVLGGRSGLKILSHKEKTNWTLSPKYSIGNS